MGGDSFSLEPTNKAKKKREKGLDIQEGKKGQCSTHSDSAPRGKRISHSPHRSVKKETEKKKEKTRLKQSEKKKRMAPHFYFRKRGFLPSLPQTGEKKGKDRISHGNKWGGDGEPVRLR